MLDIRFRLQDAGIQMVNDWGSILCGAHLYNASRKKGYLPTAWVNMKALVAIHSPERIFIGKAPSSSDQYSKHFSLAKGVDVTAFSRGRRGSERVMSKNGSRNIRVESHISKLLKSLHQFTEEVEFDAQAVSKCSPRSPRRIEEAARNIPPQLIELNAQLD